MKFKHLLAFIMLGALLSSALAGAPEFTFDRLITKAYIENVYSPRIIAGASDSDGGVYITGDLGEHSIYYLAKPRGDQNDPNYSKLVFNGEDLNPDFGSNVGQGGWLGISIDSNGTVFATGKGPTSTEALKIVRDGLTFSTALLDLPSAYSYIRLGGCSVVGPDRFVAPNYQDGSLHFFYVTDSTAFLEGVVPGPAGFTGYAPQVHYVGDKIYMTRSSPAPSPSSGGLWVWESDGTFAGTHTPTQLVAGLPEVASAHSFFTSIGYSNRHKLLAVNEGHYSPGQQGWRMYDATQTNTPWQSYLFLNGSESGGPGAIGLVDAAMGAVFFMDGEDEYFMGSNEDSPRRLYVYKVVSDTSVEDWTLY